MILVLPFSLQFGRRPPSHFGHSVAGRRFWARLGQLPLRQQRHRLFLLKTHTTAVEAPQNVIDATRQHTPPPPPHHMSQRPHTQRKQAAHKTHKKKEPGSRYKASGPVRRPGAPALPTSDETKKRETVFGLPSHLLLLPQFVDFFHWVKDVAVFIKVLVGVQPNRDTPVPT